MLVNDLRKISRLLMMNNDLESSGFLLDKICILQKYDDEDFYYYIKSLFLSQQYASIINLLTKHNNGKLWMQIILSDCYSASSKCTEALECLSFLTINNRADYTSVLNLRYAFSKQSSFLDPFEIISYALYRKAYLLEYAGNVDSTLYFTMSLIVNPLRFSAARRLFEDGLLRYNEIQNVLNEIGLFNNSSKYLKHNALEFILKFYKSFINRSTDVFTGEFRNSWHVMRWRAQRFLNVGNLVEATQISCAIVKESDNQDYLACALYATCLFQSLDSKILELFSSQFSAQDNYNYNYTALSSFIIALKLISNSKSNEALNYIKKAVSANWNAVVRTNPFCFSPSVLFMLQGHASWNCGDLENALASFTSSCDLSPGNVWTWFCLGVLHTKYNQMKIAMPFLTKAYETAKSFHQHVPHLVVNEIAYCQYQMRDYAAARRLFMKLVSPDMIKHMKPTEVCEYLPLYYLNLSHCCLRLSQYDQSLDHALKGLKYNSSFSGLYRIAGYVYDCIGSHENAQLMYHRALSLSPQLVDPTAAEKNKNFDYASLPPEGSYKMFRHRDIFCTEMLKYSTLAQSLQQKPS